MSDERKLRRLERMYKKYQRKFPEVESISVAQLQQLQSGQRKVILVDVRKPEEYEVSMLPGAITKEDFEARRDDFRDATVVPYCTAGYRSGFYAQKLMADGFEVKNLAGSVLAWSHAGETFVHEGEDTRRVHTYGPDWNLAADGYEAVWGDGPPK